MKLKIISIAPFVHPFDLFISIHFRLRIDSYRGVKNMKKSFV
jgi:hypothetical protein